MNDYQIRIKGRRGYVTWDGVDGEDACRRYAAAHPGVTVIAWRDPPSGLYIGVRPIKIIG